MKRIRKYIGVLLCLIVFAAMAMGSGSDTSVDNSNASGASDKTGTESDNVVMVGGSFEKDGLRVPLMMQIQILPITMIHMDFTSRVMGKNMSKQIFHLKITVNLMLM